MAVESFSKANLVAVLLALVAALFGRAWLQLDLLADGLPKDYAADLSYLIVPPILFVLLLPVLRQDKTFIVTQFPLAGLNFAVFMRALAVGILLRSLWWAKTIAAASFGAIRNEYTFAIEGPTFHFRCAAPEAVILGFVVMVFLVPTIEEVTHRAYVQSAFNRYGPVIAVLFSSLVFAIFHPKISWSYTFIAGLVLGTQYWRAGSVWPSLITHATYNALIQVDWRCLNTQWNPRTTDLPLLAPGVLSILIALGSTAGIFILLKNTGAAIRPDAERITER